MKKWNKEKSMYERIYEVVRSIPEGKVTTYGRVAKLAGGCTARNVGYAMAALPSGMHVPWQRVINAKGRISTRAERDEELIQRQILEAEGILFKEDGSVDLMLYGWPPAGHFH